MIKVAYLCGSTTISTSNRRRIDIGDYDEHIPPLVAAFNRAGRKLVEVLWSDTTVNWDEYEAAIIGPTWDYTERYQEFLQALTYISSQIILLNDFEIVKWNSDKRYLVELEKYGISIVPTIFCDELGTSVNDTVFSQLETDTILIKPVIGACSEGHIFVARGQDLSLTGKIGTSVMLQKFYPTISLGEKSFIFYGDKFSHSVLKKPKKDDYRVQTLFGGTDEIYTPSENELRICRNIINKIPGQSLYARIDLMTLPDGELALLECELIEPVLYYSFAPDKCDLFVKTYLSMIDKK